MNHPNQNNKVHWHLLIPLAILKMAIHIFTNTVSKYGLHRDEYLYISDSDHLAWGYMEMPPLLAVIGKMARFLFGDTLFAVRFFPALIGAVTILLVGIMVRDFGGKKYAQLIAGGAFLFSPVFLGSNNLFQPVSFNQFMWFLAVFVMVKIIKNWDDAQNQTSTNTYWYWLGLIAGLGFLTKYSIVFFFAAMIIGLLLTPYRKIFLTRFPHISLGIALVIALPNLWWQVSHNFPIVRHMNELAATQLVNVSTADFLVPQFVDHFAATFVWLPGLIFVLLSERLKPYRFLAWAYLLLILLLLITRGKAYYAYGAYTMLFALGGIAWEKWLGKKAWLLVPIIALINIPVIPLALPILPIQKMESYGMYFQKIGLSAPFRWEDGTVRTLRQDYADMHGWEEIPKKVAKIYHGLSPEAQQKCLVWGGNYGHAGVLNFYRKKYDLPQAHSFNASFVDWVPDDLEIEWQIQVEDSYLDGSDWFHSVVLLDSIDNKYARDPGYIYLKSQPKTDLRPVWKALAAEQKREAGY